MKWRYYHTSRFVQVIVSSCVLFIVILLVRIPLFPGGLLLLGSSGFGYYLGFYDWNKTRSRVDKRNVVILYATDSVFYPLLILLLFFQFAPRSISGFLEIVQMHPSALPIAIGAVCSSWFGYSLAFWRGVRAFESKHGRLVTKQFWSRSVSGQEGMTSKEGIVIDDCDPIGKVQIGAEIWNAESIDKMQIKASDPIVVRDMDGLKLIVEKVTDDS